MKRICFLIFVCMLFARLAQSQKFENDAKTFSYLTVYYVDNSDGFEADALNDEMASQLRESLENLTKRPDNYFLFYGCDGDENRTSNNLTGLLSSPTLKKYLANPTRESEFGFDKTALREYFTENPIVVKQNMEVNIFLSTNAIKRMLKEIDEIPTSVFLANELSMYVTSEEYNKIRIRIKYHINKEAEELYGTNEISKLILFCSKPLNLDQIITEIEYL